MSAYYDFLSFIIEKVHLSTKREVEIASSRKSLKKLWMLWYPNHVFRKSVIALKYDAYAPMLYWFEMFSQSLGS